MAEIDGRSVVASVGGAVAFTFGEIFTSGSPRTG